MKNIRCDKIVVQIVATEYDDLGRPLGETALPAAALFRASTADVWAFADKTLEQARKNAEAAQKATPPTAHVGGRKNRR